MLVTVGAAAMKMETAAEVGCGCHGWNKLHARGEDLDLFWFMVVLITRRMVEWSLRDGGSGTHGG